MPRFRLSPTSVVESAVLVAAFATSVLGTGACKAQEQDQSGSPTSTESPSNADVGPTAINVACANVESRLLQLTQSDDLGAYAASAGLNYDAGTVRVVVELAADGVPDPATYQLTVESQFANLLQVRVPPDQLCALASDPAVARVRAPFSAVPNPD